MIRILIVVRHSDVLDGLGTILDLVAEIEVIGTASSPDAAVQQVDQANPDIVLVDMEMPGGQGFETIRRLKEKFPRTRIIALTAHEYPAALHLAADAGANAVVVKGIDLQEMIEMMHTLANGCYQE